MKIAVATAAAYCLKQLLGFWFSGKSGYAWKEP